MTQAPLELLARRAVAGDREALNDLVRSRTARAARMKTHAFSDAPESRLAMAFALRGPERSGRGNGSLRVGCGPYQLGEIVAKRSRFTPLLESTSCRDRPVRRATSTDYPTSSFSRPHLDAVVLPNGLGMPGPSGHHFAGIVALRIERDFSSFRTRNSASTAFCVSN